MEIARLLLENGAVVDARDGLDGTALHRAAYNGRKSVVELLIKNGAAVDVKGDRFDQTPLYSAAVKGHVEVAALLISKGACVNATNSVGYTPLHVAASHGHREMVTFLLRKGADMRKRANDGVTPMDLERRGGLRVMMEFAAERLVAATPDQFVGRYAIRTAPTKGPDGRLDFSYTNLDPITQQPGRYVKRCLLIERIEGTRIIAKRVSLLSGERSEQILEGAEWFDSVWAAVGDDGEVLVG